MALQLTATKSFLNFRAAFCAHFGCLDESFPTECFRKAIDPYWRLAVGVIRRVHPDFFRPDLEYLELVGRAESWREFAGLANAIRRDATLNRGLLRRSFHLRISGGLLLKLREKMIRPSRG